MTLAAPEGESMQEYVNITAEPGVYAIGQEIPIAKFTGDIVNLFVK